MKRQGGGGVTGRVALITGGSTGIGAACVRKFLAAGWRVSVVALPGCELDRMADDNILTTAGDLTCSQIREDAVERTLSAYGRVDVLINNAGIGLYAFPTQVPIEALRRLLDVNVITPLALAQLVIPTMHKQGAGTIVTVGSVSGFVSLPWAAAYSASKSALHAVHDSLRRELGGGPVHLTKVCLGIVDTDFRKHVLAGSPPLAVHNLRWVVSPEAVANGILLAIELRRKTVYIPRVAAAFALAGVLAPSLMDRYLARFFASERLREDSCKAACETEQSP